MSCVAHVRHEVLGAGDELLAAVDDPVHVGDHAEPAHVRPFRRCPDQASPAAVAARGGTGAAHGARAESRVRPSHRAPVRATFLQLSGLGRRLRSWIATVILAADVSGRRGAPACREPMAWGAGSRAGTADRCLWPRGVGPGARGSGAGRPRDRLARCPRPDRHRPSDPLDDLHRAAFDVIPGEPDHHEAQGGQPLVTRPIQLEPVLTMEPPAVELDDRPGRVVQGVHPADEARVRRGCRR